MGVTRTDRIWNEHIRGTARDASDVSETKLERPD